MIVPSAESILVLPDAAALNETLREALEGEVDSLVIADGNAPQIASEPVEETPQRSLFGLLILLALQTKPFYEGTVSPAEKAKRRARGKRAKAARKVARR